MAKSRSRKFRFVPVLFAIVVSILGVGAVSYVRGLISGGVAPTKKVVQEIHVIRPPPPPPDQPPPPPPPPEEKVDVPDPQNKPDPTPSNEPPPSAQLGLDAEGTAGGDAFGLFGNKGGRDLVGGGGGNAYSWYAGLLKNEILDSLETESGARSGGYTVVVRVWVRPDGTIDHVRIAQSSGDRERDRVIETALSRITRLSQAPPADMPEPISLRIVSRG
jgi:periplasmic protein TonB